ncbi:BAG family molecular chaperone regulator 4 isoform X2 [Jatropha curcas]|uniref:BAG family molecular chaperone regulator 4 isoform X2 n=1 Tax=Jatropha curcas TaxID=180498 RepID=UPI0005FC00AD|nr:BAG family molecular chaperone regulator 4 isoform X2 [Jatropha curcas]XP_037494727.1 BAG family molecular chaperone regulator 4 isoform X2 [Jatropha curcas]
MKNSSSKTEDWEVRAGGMLVQRREADDDGAVDGPLITINFSHDSSQHEIHVPAQSTFGVKDKSKVLVLENVVSKEKLEDMKESEGTSKAELQESEEMSESKMKENEENSKAFQAIAEVREEVDKLAERVAALEVAVNSGTKIAEEEFVISAELLMRQLLKLDSIEADGEAKMQRKAEVRRVQNYHEVLDNLKTNNSKPFSNSSNAVSVTTEWETFDSGVGSLNPPPVSSSTRITQDWERFD